MSVKKIFTTLIIVVACVLIGAFTLNLLLPNVTKSLVNAVEQQIFNATGLSFDFNNDGTGGKAGGNNTFTGDIAENEGGGAVDGGNVAGFN